MDIYSIHNIENLLNPYLRYLKFLPDSLFSKSKFRTVFLLYHSVSQHRKGKKSHHFTISLQKFRSQLKFLHENNYRVLSVLEWYKSLRNQKKGSDRTVVLTFDDGYADNFYYVSPILKKYNFKATFYPICNHIDQNKKFPWLNEPNYPLNANLPLNSRQICQMDEEGMEIGSHTLSHTKLTQLSKQDSWKEIKESKDRIEEILGHSISSFSYPFGAWFDFKSSHQSMVKKAGYKSAVTSIYGSNSYHTNMTLLKRIPVYYQETLESFAMKVNGYYSWVGKLQWFLSNVKHRL